MTHQTDTSNSFKRLNVGLYSTFHWHFWSYQEVDLHSDGNIEGDPGLGQDGDVALVLSLIWPEIWREKKKVLSIFL